MNAIGEPDISSGSIVVEAGVILSALHEALLPHRLIFPLHLGSEGSAHIGGLIGTNAGGSHAMRYGMMQDLVLGVEVVLPEGTVWDGLRAVQKDNTGYQLRKLFCGSEGTLGVVTRAVLKLYPEPKREATALLTVPGTAALAEFGAQLRREAGEFINAVEFFSDFGLELVLKHVTGTMYPLGTRGSFHLLVELATSSAKVPVDDILTSVLEWGIERELVLDAVLATSIAQRANLWRLREAIPEGQRLEAPQLKNDISVPVGRMRDFLVEAQAVCTRILPGVRCNPFGHLGDGNVHYNLSPREGSADFSNREADISQALAELATTLGGSFAAEHGLGRSKIWLAEANRSRVERRLMESLKSSIDPRGTMNPGVIVSFRSVSEKSCLEEAVA